ncbi:adenylosuccinate lyase [Amnibacterium sp. CER49]|uniref:adenylosuccinate lyase n=1 Tax=Amnibacterium sp. CER49 TaxID=3039161 RepID=UPI00244D6F01|nr:adenylosuccinate lyase [Amnibacterium sp. CER49]MDH2443647.1 adenylosuccinate lyase [Amnibacterium sp. CER49]
MPLIDEPLSPLDGRYRAAAAPLAEHLSEAGLNRARIRVEVEWLIALTDAGVAGTAPLAEHERASLRELVDRFGADEVAELGRLEATTRHDVKAVEYLVRAHLAAVGLERLAELTHFAFTSEDVNNLAVALTVRDAVHDVWLPAVDRVLERLTALARDWAGVPMLARTHGQPATPTTTGKELAVFAARLRRLRDKVAAVEVLGKSNGASGDYAAHVVAAPDVDWQALSQRFVEGLGLTWNPLTTQIESHDWQVELYGRIVHLNGVLHNLCTDVWLYIAFGYLKQVPVAGATGSSTMPHKVNPIRFENAEANLELSNGVLGTLSATLVTSRLQRDLTDSTTQRNIGVGLGHSLVALDNVARGLTEIDVDAARMREDLESNQEVLGEAVQTVVRAEIAAGRSALSNPYELLKDLTRGRRITAEDLRTFVAGLGLEPAATERLTALTPATYTGLAARLVEHLGD